MNIIMILDNIFVKNLNKHKCIAINIIINIIGKRHILYVLIDLEAKDDFIL